MIIHDCRYKAVHIKGSTIVEILYAITAVLGKGTDYQLHTSIFLQ